MIYKVSKRMEVAGAHRLNLSYKSKCQNLHGHNWIITIFCAATELNEDGMVCDFKHITNCIHGYLTTRVTMWQWRRTGRARFRHTLIGPFNVFSWLLLKRYFCNINHINDKNE